MARPYYFGVFTALTATAIAALVVLLVVSTPASAISSVYTVNSTADHDDGSCVQPAPFNPGGDCTLREAINAANNTSGADTIDFSIPDASCNATTKVCTIQVGGTIGPTAGTMLPNIREAVTIDGYTQRPCSSNLAPCSKPNTNDLKDPQGDNANLLIELDGTSAGSAVSGLLIFNPGGPAVSNVVIKGLVINRFSNTGITMTGFGSGNRVEGNFIGTNPSGNAALPNGQGNGHGVSVNGFGDTVGGTSNDTRNVISGNDGDGVSLNGPGAKVQGNYIGTKADGNFGLPNTADGVVAANDNATVGGESIGANVIAFNNVSGVRDSSIDSTGNSFFENSIHSNGKLGIDLQGGNDPSTGVTPNDKKDPDTGPNNLQNYPVLTSTKANSDGTTTVTGKLNSRPRKFFVIQLFSNIAADSPSGFGEGKTFLGQITKKTSRKGSLSFSFTKELPPGENVITATATNLSTLDTSEFSKAITAS